jgi:hypothetical protein
VADHDLNALLMTRDLRARSLGIMVAVGSSSFPAAYAAESVSHPTGSIHYGIAASASYESENSSKTGTAVESPSARSAMGDGINLLADTDFDEHAYWGQDIKSLHEHNPSHNLYLNIDADTKKWDMMKVAKMLHTPGVDRISARLIDKFRAIRHHEGFWLNPFKHTTVNALKMDLEHSDGHLIVDVDDEDLQRIHKEVMDGDAMYFAHDRIHRLDVIATDSRPEIDLATDDNSLVDVFSIVKTFRLPLRI